MYITRVSPYTGEENTLSIPVTQTEIDRWEGGELIQNAMPHLTPDQREFLISGLYPGEFEEMFDSMDNDDEDN